MIELAAGGEAGPAAPIREAAALLRAGEILAVKGLGGFHLACDATDGDVVRRLKRRKRRPDKPLAVMFAGLDELRAHCRVGSEEAGLLTSPEHPIVLLEWRAVGPSRRDRPGGGRGRRPAGRPGGGRPPALPRRDASVHAAPRAAPPGRRPAAGDDQRQPGGGADRQGLGGDRPARADRRCLSRARPGDRRALRRLRRAGARRQAAADPPVPGLRPVPGAPAPAAPADAGGRRRAQEHLLPHARRQRLPQPAHRRPREPGDAGALRSQRRGLPAPLPARARGCRLRSPPGVPGDQVRAVAAAEREGGRAAPPRPRSGAAGRTRQGGRRHRRQHGRPRLRPRRPAVGWRDPRLRSHRLPPGRAPRGTPAARRSRCDRSSVADRPRLELRSPRARRTRPGRCAAQPAPRRGRRGRRAEPTRRCRRWSGRSTSASTRRSRPAAAASSTP